eukprot:6055063-Lingulodinium_polyedra.AAC.1
MIRWASWTAARKATLPLLSGSGTCLALARPAAASSARKLPSRWASGSPRRAYSSGRRCPGVHQALS